MQSSAFNPNSVARLCADKSLLQLSKIPHKNECCEVMVRNYVRPPQSSTNHSTTEFLQHIVSDVGYS